VSTDPELLTGAALTVFRLNGQFLGIAEDLARPAGLTAARWQVLGAVLHTPLSVAGIARVMGISRQSVQRIADLLVEQGLAEYLPNPSHRRAKLLQPTDQGRAAIAQIRPRHAVVARRLTQALDRDKLSDIIDGLTLLSTALDTVAPDARRR
jgi:DNA-binding MarR family transcriptional regulator